MTVMTDLKKIFYAIFLFFAFSNTASYSEVVNKIKVTGNERISKETIVVFGDITIGQNYDSEDIVPLWLVGNKQLMLKIKQARHNACQEMFTPLRT